MSTPPSVDPERIEALYQELASMQVELDADPLALGPKRINAKTAECRALLSRTERIFLEVSQDLYWYKREYRRAQADFDLAVQSMMANDPEVRAGRNITDREAIAHTKLKTDREKISTLRFACEDLEAVLTVVKTKRNDLKDIASRLRDQLKICQEEIALGGRWGMRGKSRMAPPAEAAPAPVTPLGSVDRMLDEALLEEDSNEDPEDGEDSHVAESDLEDFLEKPHPPKPLPGESKSDASFDAHLEDLGKHLPEEPKIEPKKDDSLDEILDMF